MQSPSAELQPTDIFIQDTLAMISTFQIYLKYQTYTICSQWVKTQKADFEMECSASTALESPKVISHLCDKAFHSVGFFWALKHIYLNY